MLQIRRILHPTDFSHSSRQALNLALLFAREFSAELHLLHAVVLNQEDPSNPEHHFPEGEELLDRLSTVASSEMARLMGLAHTGSVSVREIQRRGYSPGPVILDYAAEAQCDLIVMGTHGHRGAARLVLGSVAEEVVRHARCPVLTVRERKEDAPLEALGHVLVPVDFSEHSQRAVSVARELATMGKARLDLVHVVEPPTPPAFYPPDLAWRVTEDLRTRAGEELAALVGKSDLEVTTHVLTGHPATEIVDLAREIESGLIVMPTHGRTGLKRLLMGSTAEQVARMAPCPVLILSVHAETPDTEKDA